MSDLKIGISPLTNEIYIGSVSKCGKHWLSNKTNVTNGAVYVVADHVLGVQRRTGESVILKGDGVCDLKITVEELPIKKG